MQLKIEAGGETRVESETPIRNGNPITNTPTSSGNAQNPRPSIIIKMVTKRYENNIPDWSSYSAAVSL